MGPISAGPYSKFRTEWAPQRLYGRALSGDREAGGTPVLAEGLRDPAVAGAVLERGAEAGDAGRRRFVAGNRPLVGQHEREEEGGGGEVGDAEGVTGEVPVGAELGLEAVERGNHLVARDLGCLLAADTEAHVGVGA